MKLSLRVAVGDVAPFAGDPASDAGFPLVTSPGTGPVAGRASASARGGIVDVTLDVSPDHRVQDLADALAQYLGIDVRCLVELARTGRVPRSDRPLAETGLVHGDLIRLRPLVDAEGVGDHGASGAARSFDPRVGYRFVVISGPDAGRSVPLHPGSHVVGRHRSDSIQLTDPFVSRRALNLTLVGDEVTVAPRRGGVSVKGESIGGATVLGPDDVVTVGTTRFVVRDLSADEAHVQGRYRVADGVVAFHRTPSPHLTIPDPGLVPFGPIPAEQRARRFGVLSIVAPLLAGVGMYLVTGRLLYLLFTALSPIIAIARYVEDRRSGARQARKEVAQFRSAIDERCASLRVAQNSERMVRVRQSPDVYELEWRATHRTANLWCRQRSSADFGRLRLGLGEVQATFSASLAPGGDLQLRAEAEAAFSGSDRIACAPVTAVCADGAVVGIYPVAGEGSVLVDQLVASLVVQAAVLHSPKDMRMVIISGGRRPLEWARWLPHVTDDQTERCNVAFGAEDGGRLLEEFVSRARARADAQDDEPVWPRTLVVIDGELDLDPVQTDLLLHLGPHAGIDVVWIAGSMSGIARQARVLVELGREDGETVARLWGSGTEGDSVFSPELLSAEQAERVAHACAPLRDATSEGVSPDIPDVVPTFDLYDSDALRSGDVDVAASWVADQWVSSSRDGLRSRVGVGRNGIVDIDLVTQGPHSLVGGTTGSGKSELLQSLVVGLAMRYPPEHVNFLFVDYKGGASSQMFGDLPHTVGLVTNLDESMAMRALESLRAELNRRMRLMEGRAKDLDELVHIDPDAPPSLVIICDEFATLIKEIPEFVAGIVDIAQRGRSLGVHLVLATQHPSSAINDSILANTNLRIALRTAENASTTIIGSSSADKIPDNLKGRMFVRTGSAPPQEVQCGYTGAPAVDVADGPIRVSEFGSLSVGGGSLTGRGERSGAEDGTPRVPTQLDAIVEAIVEAERRRDRQPVRRPWCEPLPEVLHLDELIDLGRSDEDLGARITPRWRLVHNGKGRSPQAELLIGLADRPDLQEQLIIVDDLESSGGMIVFGSTGCGKTTFIRSTLAATTMESIVIDGSSRPLGDVSVLPNVHEVYRGDDPEGLTRLIVALEDEVDRRRDDGFTSRLLLLVDDWAVVMRTLAEIGSASDSWPERLQAVILDGRGVGVHTVVTAERSNDVAARVQSAMSSRLIMHHGDSSQYANYGIPTQVGRRVNLPPGRGLFGNDIVVQLGIVAGALDDPAAALAKVAAGSASRIAPATVAPPPLPNSIILDAVPVDLATTTDIPQPIEVGVADVTGDRVLVDLSTSDLAVVGYPGTGRSTTLAAIAQSAVRSGFVPYVIGTPHSGLRNLVSGERWASVPVAGAAFDDDAIQALLADLRPVELREERHRRILIVDDVDQLGDAHGAAIHGLIRSLTIVGASDVRAVAGYSSNPTIAHLKKVRSSLVLQPDDPAEVAQLTGARVRIRPGIEMVPGRALLSVNRRSTVVQLALPRPVSHPAPRLHHLAQFVGSPVGVS